MNNIKQSNFSLNRNEIKTLGQADHKTRLFCLEGEAWITAEDDLTDYLLEAGSEITLCCRKGVLIQSLSPKMMMEVISD